VQHPEAERHDRPVPPPDSSAPNALTIDWEDWYHGLLDHHAEWDGFEARLAPITDQILSWLDERGVSATFFVLGHAAERHPELVRRIHAAGHEIASHGHAHRFVSSQSREEFRRDTERAAKFLADLLSAPIHGYRASTFTVTKETLWALDVIEECGFRYDSSIFPVRNPVYGIPDAPRFPHRLKDRDLWEVPPSTLRVGTFNLPVAGGFYLRVLPLWLLRGAYRKILRAGEPIVFYTHPWEMDPGQPAGPYKLSWRIARRVGLRHTAGRFRSLLESFDWGTVSAMLAARA